MGMAALAACATAAAPPGSAQVLADPQRYLARSVTVCGFADGPYNLFGRRPGRARYDGPGLTLSGKPREVEAAAWQFGRVCVTGVVFHAGCAAGACPEGLFDYGLKVSRVRRG
jgi:hypothetical protein